jgi:lysophospholipase L1-like esterase
MHLRPQRLRAPIDRGSDMADNVCLHDRHLACRYRGRAFRRFLAFIVAAALSLTAGAGAKAQALAWISSWTASPQAPRGVIPGSLANRTIRQIVHLSLGGKAIRIRLSNEFGSRPLVIGAASIAIAGENSGILAASPRPLSFGGATSVIIPSGAPAMSDPVELDVAALSDLAVSLYLPAQTELDTVHVTALATGTVSAAGDFTASAQFPVADRFVNRFFLTGVMVAPAAPARAIVVLGDSISDGTRSSVDANARWPDVLARRLNAAGMAIAVQNQGISGNRVLSDGAGASALARFDRDVLSQPGVSHVVLFLGINDLGWPGTAIEPRGAFRSAEEIIAGYRQLIERTHVRSIKVIGAPLTPFENALAGGPNQGYFTLGKEAKRQAVNRWIRMGGAYDGIIDFESVLADPTHPAALAAPYDSGDHLHPNDAGYKAMGESIDLKLFQ